MLPIRTKARVGDDGVLALQIPLGPGAAGMEVQIIIEATPAPCDDDSIEQREWRQRLSATYGACAGLGLERPEQLPFEERELIE